MFVQVGVLCYYVPEGRAPIRGVVADKLPQFDPEIRVFAVAFEDVEDPVLGRRFYAEIPLLGLRQPERRVPVRAYLRPGAWLPGNPRYGIEVIELGFLYTADAVHALLGASGPPAGYAQQRYYDPLSGWFVSIDPVATDAETGGNFNRYWYARNNPYTFADPDGRQELGVESLLRIQDPTFAAGQDIAAEKTVGFLFCGCDVTFVAPPGSGALQPVVTPFEFMAAGAVSRAASSTVTAGAGGLHL